MFFEPPAGDEPEFWRHESRPWSGPPPLETGTTVPLDRVVARSSHVVLALPGITAFSTGCMLNSSGARATSSGEIGVSAFGLWLWPLPPAEAFGFAVEWPCGGIELPFTELDGAAIVAAAARSGNYWPD